MLELGIFQHRMVLSTPPEKQRSPFGETVRARTGPVCALKILSQKILLHPFNKTALQGTVGIQNPNRRPSEFWTPLTQPHC